MAATRAFLWLDTRGTRRDLSRPDAASHVNPHRIPAEIPASMRKRNTVTDSTVAGSTVIDIQPRDVTPTADVVYLHGGGYVSPMGQQHWWIVDHLLRCSGARVRVPYYPLAPEHTFDEALPMLTELYSAVVAEAEGRRLVFAGDSAGGGLCVVQAIRARDNGWRPADRLVLFAPWFDVTLSDPEAERLEAKDPILRCVGARDDGRAWAGVRSATDPLVSPINDDLASLPPMTIIQGGRDIFLPDAITFTDKARAAGTSIELLVEPGGFHVYPAAFWTPEARRAYAVTAKAILG